MTRLWRRAGYELVLFALLAMVLVSGLFVVTVALPDMVGGTAAPTATAAYSASPPPVIMSWVDLPADAECSACHVTAQGGVGLVPVPKMAHPLRGWTDCTACHANDRLVATAPGHAGIHAADCLMCHEPDQLPVPLSRPHRDRQNQECLTCHGGTAPIPNDMAHRPESVCWLCHRLPDDEPPPPAHAINVGQSDCLTCHDAAQGRPLPTDHTTRTVDECLLCHVPQPGASPAPPSGSMPRRQGWAYPLLSVLPLSRE